MNMSAGMGTDLAFDARPLGNESINLIIQLFDEFFIQLIDGVLVILFT